MANRGWLRNLILGSFFRLRVYNPHNFGVRGPKFLSQVPTLPSSVGYHQQVPLKSCLGFLFDGYLRQLFRLQGPL